MSKISLRHKFSLTLVFGALILITSTSLVSYFTLLNRLKTQLREYGELVSIIISEATEAVDSYDQMRYSLESLTHKTSSIYGITLVTKKPFIIWASSFHPNGDIDRYTQEMLAAVKLSSEQGVFGRFFYDDGDLVILRPVGETFITDRTDHIAFHKASVKNSNGLNPDSVYSLDVESFEGVLYLRLDWEATKKSVQDDLIYHIVIATTGTLLMLVLSLIFLYRFVLKPVEAISNMAIKHREGALHIRLTGLSDDEIGELGNTLNNMLDKVQENDQRFRNLYELLPDPAWIIDDDHFVECNQAALTMLGYKTKDELLNRHPSKFSPEKQPDGENSFNKAERMIALATEKGIHRFEWVHTRADGTDFITEITLSSIILNAKPVVYCVWRDITERKQNEEKIVQYAETQAVLLREVNHRVKNNLSSIISMLHKEEDRAEEEGLTEYIPRLKETVGRVDGLLAVHSMLSKGGWQPLFLNQLCEQIISKVIHGSPTPQAVVCDVTASDILVDSDQAHYLTLVLNELATNTTKYAIQNRGIITIQVSIHHQDGSILLVYHDDGPGLPEFVLNGKFPERCIGFKLINGIVRQSLQGKIEFVNDAGATVKITFPAMTSESKNEARNHW